MYLLLGWWVGSWLNGDDIKELVKNDLLNGRESIESVQHKQKEVELAFLNHLKPLKGHTLYEVNNSTLEVVRASYNRIYRITWYDAVRMYENPRLSTVKDVIIKPFHSYISALNPRMALKRHIENKGSASLPEGIDIKLF